MHLGNSQKGVESVTVVYAVAVATTVDVRNSQKGVERASKLTDPDARKAFIEWLETPKRE